jgi:transcriptional regulator with XRE-family HTH domain
VAHWLAERRNVIGITQKELARRIGKAQSAIASWELGRNISMLADPNEAILLANALEWDLAAMLKAAGYPIDTENVKVSESVRNVIEEIHKLKPHLVDAFCHMLVHFIEDFRENLSDIDPAQLIRDVNYYKDLPSEPNPNDDSKET